MKQKPLIKPECPACRNQLNTNQSLKKFYRVDHYEARYIRITGYLCDCGYLVNSENLPK